MTTITAVVVSSETNMNRSEREKFRKLSGAAKSVLQKLVDYAITNPDKPIVTINSQPAIIRELQARNYLTTDGDKVTINIPELQSLRQSRIA